MEKRYRYKDQLASELYDWYDYDANEPTPEPLLQAKVLREIDEVKTIQMDYPLKGNEFSLNGEIGYLEWYAGYAKKAWIRGGEYRHPKKGFVTYIKYMHPNDYVRRCTALFNKDRPADKKFTMSDVIENREYYDVMVFDQHKGNIFPPMINYREGGQEGLHRAMYAEKKGIQLIPVIIIY